MSYETTVEVDIRVDYDIHKGEKQTWNYPGSPPDAEITGIRFVTDEWVKGTNKNGKEIKSIEDLAEYVLSRDVESLVEQAWEDHRSE